MDNKNSNYKRPIKNRLCRDRLYFIYFCHWFNLGNDFCKYNSDIMGKRKVLNEKALKEVVLPQEGEMFGRVVKHLGSELIQIKCTDGKIRIGRIRGKLKRRVWIRDNDVVLIAPWDFKADERGDILWRYTIGQVEWLQSQGHLPKDL